jgi:pilus assembly protein Flp/PilA
VEKEAVDLKNKWKQLLLQENGQGMTEYGLVMGVISVGVISILLSLKQEIFILYNQRVQPVIATILSLS